MSTIKQRKRYRLHQVIKHDFRYNAQSHTVMVPFDFEKKNYNDKVIKALEQLQKLNYSLQTEIR